MQNHIADLEQVARINRLLHDRGQILRTSEGRIIRQTRRVRGDISYGLSVSFPSYRIVDMRTLGTVATGITDLDALEMQLCREGQQRQREVG